MIFDWGPSHVYEGCGTQRNLFCNKSIKEGLMYSIRQETLYVINQFRSLLDVAQAFPLVLAPIMALTLWDIVLWY